MGEEANCNILMEAAVAAKAKENGNGHAGAAETKAAAWADITEALPPPPPPPTESGVVDPRLKGISDAIRVVPHFPKPGIMFNDITTLLLLPAVFKDAVDIFVERYRDMGIDAVAGIEARGFIFGPAIALAIGAKFIPLRKPKKLPGEVISETYVLEYGTDCLEMHVGAIEPGERVLIVDDLVATGGTLCAAIGLLVEFAASSTPDPAGPMVSVDRLRAYLQIVDVASILRLDRDIADHAFELFKDCSSATCLRNRSVEALATAALVQAIREAQEPRTLQIVLELTLLSARVSLGSQNLRISTSSMVNQYMCWWSPASMKNKKLIIRNAHGLIPYYCK
ncbi:hypothetical protein GUJ93_ZPchr0006g45813 [Zizania palustris]|uniref:adenine phosphoribosyltransferase n=1 Tax=Zizania palustris TaxID=103762 RepID=A0A8J5SZS7_ZIZPA|nr:hypothetical protein GUJ93_ZPchr0006g45813 [Zizania palustris]